MDRIQMVRRLENSSHIWDLVVVGGGATGLGTAVESASRGFDTLLLEQDDFCKGTSSRSTKLVHGGVRYLQRGDISLVLEALRERGLLIRNAPHLVNNLSFVLPYYSWWEGPFYGTGMKVYDMLAGKLGLGPSLRLSPQQTIQHIPTLETKGLRGGVMYHDGQFDDARLGISLALTAADHGAALINYFGVTGFLKVRERICGVLARDLVTQRDYEIRSRVVINATGVFSDQLMKMDEPESPGRIVLSQGIHIILNKRVLPGNTAIMVPRTDDGRVLFALPWLDRVLLGTTDTLVGNPSLEPGPLPEELDFLMSHARRYLTSRPSSADICSIFAGLRPLIRSASRRKTATLSRRHCLSVSRSGLLTIAGGKWTTYRKMGQDTVDYASLVSGLEKRASVTENLRIHGFKERSLAADSLGAYGTNATLIRDLIAERPFLGAPIHPGLPYLKAQIVWAVRQEMAITLEDVLSRRTRCLLLDARAAMASALDTARIMAGELNRDPHWIDDQVKSFCLLAKGYLPDEHVSDFSDIER
jgi:glycerol-3-phosphate dehydrogenase